MFDSVQSTLDITQGFENRPVGSFLRPHLLLIRFEQHLQMSLKRCQRTHSLSRLLFEYLHPFCKGA